MIPQQVTTAQRRRTGVPPDGFNDEGFLADTDGWTPSLALDIARSEGLGVLTPKHWEVIHLVRARYFSLGALPVMRLMCRAASLDPHHAHRLFSSCLSLWRIAGLPNPGEEARSYMN